jgi:hypothetical protein
MRASAVLGLLSRAAGPLGTVAAALALVGCGSGGSLEPQQYPGAAEQLVTAREVERQPADSPQRALISWWRSAQFAERMDFLAGFDSAIRDRLSVRLDFDKELDYFAGGIRVAKPHIANVERENERATVYVVVNFRQPVGATRFVVTTVPQAFPMVREAGKWRLADDHFFRARIAPLRERQSQS